MAKLNSAPDANDVSAYKTVFIDTNLDTHLALIVSDLDTVSDLKKRIQFEHPLCFPDVGKIQIHALKVKRRGYFYHLSDSMSVSSAFNGVNKSWFLSVDASGTGEHEKNQNLLSPVCSNQEVSHAIANNAPIGIVDIPLSCPPKGVSSSNNFLLPGFDNRQDGREQVPEQTGKEVLNNVETSVEPFANYHPEIPSGTINERQSHCCVDTELPSSRVEGEVDGSSRGVNDEGNVCVESTLKAIPSAITKCKSKRKREDMVHDDLKENNDTVLEPNEDAIQQDTIVHEKSLEKENREASMQNGENNIANGLCVNSSSNTCKRSSTGLQMPIEEFKETEVLKENLECNNDNTKNGIDNECNESMREPAEPGPANKKHKRRKKSSIHDSKEETLKSEIASQKSDEACKRTEERRELVEFNNEKATNGIGLLHNKSSEEAAVTRPSVKKKRKIKERGGDDDPLKETRSIICDSTEETLISENASHHLLEDQQKIEHSNAEQPSEHFDGSDPLRISALHGKRKRKKDLIPHQTVMVSSSNNNGEAKQCRIEGSDVQDAVFEDGQISKDISMDEAAVDNTEMRTGACKEGVPSEVKETEYSKKHFINMKGHPSNVNEPRDVSEDGKVSMHGVTHDRCDKSDPRHTDHAEEGREMLLKNDPKPILLGNCTLSNQEKADAIIREVPDTSKILESNGITDPEKPKMKRKRTRKTKESGGGPELAEGIRPVDVPESELTLIEFHEATNCNPTSENTEKEQNLLNQTDAEDGPQEEMKGYFDEKEIDYVKANDAVFSEQIGKTFADAGKKVDEKKRKISKKKQNSTAKSRSDMVKATLGELQAATDCDPTSGNTEKVENLLNQADGEDGPQKEMKGNLDEKEIDYVRFNGAVSSEQIGKTLDDAEKKVDEKKRKISKKKQNSTAKSQSDMVKATLGEFHSTADCDPTSGNTEKVENLLNQTGGKNGPQEEMKGTSDEKEIDYVKANDAVSSEQIGKTQVDAEKNVDVKRRKISRKKQNSAAKSRSDMVKAMLGEFHAATNCGPTSGNTETVENLLNQTEGENGPQEEMKGTSDEKEIDYIKANDAVSSEQIGKTQVDAEKNVDEKRRKISKKKQNSAANGQSDMVKAMLGKFHAATNCDPTSGNTETVENILNRTEGENGLQEEMKGTSDEKEIDYVKAKDAGSSKQIGKTQVDAEKKVDEKRRKISKKKKNSAANSQSDIVAKDQLFDPKEPLLSSDSRPLVETSSKIAKKNKSATTNATNKLIGSDLQLERDSIGTDPPQIPSSITDGNEKLAPLDANDTRKHSPRSFGNSGNRDNNDLPASPESNKINYDQHFLSEQQQHEAMLPDNMNGDVKPSGKKQKVRATEGKNQAGTVGSTQLQGLLSKAEGDGLRNYSDNKVSKVHTVGQGALLFSQSKSVTSTINKNRKPLKASEQSDKKRESSIISNTNPEGSKKMLQYKAGKNSVNNTWGVVSNTEQKKKSLLSGAIFKDDSSGLSEDEVASNASTRTPSDNSLSSDYSDGESNAGCYGGKRLENSGRSATLAGSKGMSIDKFLRGSSTFKKAKLTASQFEETESPLDFVPDSQSSM